MNSSDQVVILEQKLNTIFSRYRRLFNNQKIAVVVSGGIDSSIIAYYTSKFFDQTHLYTLHSSLGKDLPYAKKLADFLKKPLRVVNFNKESASLVVPKVKKVLLQKKISPNLTQLSLATGFYLLFEKISKQKIRLVFTGQGPDVLLGGYHRYRSIPLRKMNKAIKKDLPILELDKKRDQAVADIFGVRLINPYLEGDFVQFSFSLPPFYKYNQGWEKAILRDLGKKLGLPGDILRRHKKAFQYSTRLQRIVFQK